MRDLTMDDIVKPLPPHLFVERPTVAALLITPQHGLVLNRRSSEMPFVPPQGGIQQKRKRRESALDALQREDHEELPCVELKITSAAPLFCCEHKIGDHLARQCWDTKIMFWLAVYVDDVPPYQEEMGGHEYIETRADDLPQYLTAMSSGKREMVLEAIKRARKLKMLDWPEISDRYTRVAA